jgi:DNA-binding CsgD family transcriptional regulator
VATIVDDANPSRSNRVIDLSRLNDSERKVLRLLAEGHTAKSIANALGSTPAAVNERLREARRKTGVGSSRELARLLKAQENRDEQLGVADRFVARPSISALAAKPWRLHSGVFAMIGLFFVVTAGAAALLSQDPLSSGQVDPLVGRPIERFSQPADLHSKVRTERSDPSWADPAEEAIRARLMRIPLVGKGGNDLRVTCGVTLCEIAGTLIGEGKPIKDYDPKLPFDRAILDLQDKPLHDDLASLGLKNESNTFVSGEGKPSRLVFFLYYSRTES